MFQNVTFFFISPIFHILLFHSCSLDFSCIRACARLTLKEKGESASNMKNFQNELKAEAWTSCNRDGQVVYIVVSCVYTTFL